MYLGKIGGMDGSGRTVLMAFAVALLNDSDGGGGGLFTWHIAVPHTHTSGFAAGLKSYFLL